MEKEFNLIGEFSRPNPYIKDVISNDSVNPIIEHLEADEKNTAVLNIHSEGGSADVLAYMKGKLRPHKSRIEAKIIGVALSAGAALPIAVADKISMNKGARMMVHLPRIGVRGNSEEVQSTLNLLKIIDEELTEDLASRSKLSKDEAKEMLRKETYLSAEEAKDKGIVDEVIEPPSAEFVKDLVLKHIPEENKQSKVKKEEEESILEDKKEQEVKTPEVKVEDEIQLMSDTEAQAEVRKERRLSAEKDKEISELKAIIAKSDDSREDELNEICIAHNKARGVVTIRSEESDRQLLKDTGAAGREYLNAKIAPNESPTIKGYSENEINGIPKDYVEAGERAGHSMAKIKSNYENLVKLGVGGNN